MKRKVVGAIFFFTSAIAIAMPIPCTINGVPCICWGTHNGGKPECPAVSPLEVNIVNLQSLQAQGFTR